MANLDLEQEKYKELIVQYLCDSISLEDLEDLNAWLNLHSNNKLFFDECREVWLASKAIANPQGFNPKMAYQNFLFRVNELENDKSKPRVRKISFSFPGVAAAVLLAFGLGILIQHLQISKEPRDIAQQVITVPLGSKTSIELPDGTLVTLNAGSKLTYKSNYGIANREVWLEGEGYFSVAKDKARTFVVKTNFLDIKALGTQFNVKAYPNEKCIQTTLVEGIVKIEKTKNVTNSQLKDNPVILNPKERYTFNIESASADLHKAGKSGTLNKNMSTGPEIADKTDEITKNIDPLPDISWKEKRWIISHEKLETLAVKLERRYDVKINFDSEKLKSYCFSGTLQDESIEQVLKVISISSPVVYEIKGKQVVFYTNKEFSQKYKQLYKSN